LPDLTRPATSLAEKCQSSVIEIVPTFIEVAPI
jgi:hypothetical protein